MSHVANGSVIRPQGAPHGVLIVAVSGGNSKRFGSPHLMQWTAPTTGIAISGSVYQLPN